MARQRIINQKNHQPIRYNDECVNGRLKDEFGGCVVRVKGNQKVMCRLMLGIIALIVD